MAAAQNVTSWFYLQKCLKDVSLMSAVELFQDGGGKTGGGRIPPPPRKIGLMIRATRASGS